MGKRGAAEGLHIDWVTLLRPSPEPSPPSAADLAPRSARSADSFSASSPARPTRKRGGGAHVDIDWRALLRPGTPEPPEAPASPPPAATVVPRSAGVGNDEQINERKRASRMRVRKGAKKSKKSEDPMVRVMEMYVEMRKKQAEDGVSLLAKESAESRNAQDFSISRCIPVLHRMEGIRRDESARAYNVFRNAENREIFLASAAVDEETTVLWLRSEMAELPRGTWRERQA